MAACQKLNRPQLAALYKELLDALQKSKGAHRDFKPMYPNFPDEVMEAAEGELYLNALLHYLTDGRFLPEAEAKLRLPLLETTKIQIIDTDVLRIAVSLSGGDVSLAAAAFLLCGKTPLKFASGHAASRPAVWYTQFRSANLLLTAPYPNSTELRIYT